MAATAEFTRRRCAIDDATTRLMLLATTSNLDGFAAELASGVELLTSYEVNAP